MSMARSAKAHAVAVSARSACLALSLAGSLLATGFEGGAQAGAAFDGTWKVVIITQSGTCDPAYTYPVRVSGGRVSYAGEGGFEISGHVADGGGVNVAIARGEQRASASGKLTASGGSGQWSGKSSATACSGRWEASRMS
jgi:hypothetical protein